MHWSPFTRAVPLPRRSRRAPAAPAQQSAVHPHRRRRAEMGLDVPPVHGWHCICERCQRETDSAA